MGFEVSQGSTRAPAPAGTHLARCRGLVDLGTQDDTFEGKAKYTKKMWLWWELLNEEGEDGKPVVIGARYTASLNDKSGLYKMLISWRGRPFTPEELKGFSLDKLINAPCQLSVIHEAKPDGKVRDKITGVTGVVKGMTAGPLRVPVVAVNLDADKFDRAAYDALPNFLKDVIGKSPEGKALGLSLNAPAGGDPHNEWGNHKAPAAEVATDEIPF